MSFIFSQGNYQILSTPSNVKETFKLYEFYKDISYSVFNSSLPSDINIFSATISSKLLKLSDSHSFYFLTLKNIDYGEFVDSETNYQFGAYESSIELNFFKDNYLEDIDFLFSIGYLKSSIDIFNSDKESSILINEVNQNMNNLNTNSLTNLVSVAMSNNIDYLIKFDINKIDNSFYSNPNQLKIFNLEDDNIVIYETLFDGEYVFSEVDKPGVFGVLYDDLQQNNEIPESVNILSCYPNPFNPNLNIEYIIDNPSSVIIEVYDLQGRKINVLENTFKESGKYNITWNGIDFSGNEVSSGIYLIKMNYGSNLFNQKVTFMK